MNKILRKIFYLFFPLLFMLYLLFCINILITDWKYAHKNFNIIVAPFNWSKSSIEINLKKILNNFFKKNNKIGLEPYFLYISEINQNLLISDIPISNKNWIPAYIKINDKLQKIKLRLNGDNTDNLLLNKKSYRIKSKKKERFNRNRHLILENLPSKETNYWESFIASKLAKDIGVITPNVKLIEVFINDNSNGIYVLREHVNEDLLRKNKIMPINIYKGEQANLEEKLFIDQDLYNNPFLWKKIALFNQVEKEDYSDLYNQLNFIKKSNNKDKFIDFFNINSNDWARFNALQILTQNYQTDNFHNSRIAIDPWTGSMRPIFIQPMNMGLNKEIFSFEKSTNQILSLFNQNSEFIHKKYILINDLLNKDIFLKNINYLKKLEEKIKISMSRDSFLSEPFYKIDTNKPKREIIDAKKNKKFIEKFYERILTREQNLKSIFFDIPKATWFQSNSNNKNIQIFISEILPSCNIKIKFDGIYNGKITIDKNHNNIADKNEFSIDVFDKEVKLPICLYANRIKVKKERNDLNRDAPYLVNEELIKTINTKFNFLLDTNMTIKEINNNNFFTKKSYIIKNKKPNYSTISTKFNTPVILQKKIEDKILFSGLINIDEDLIVNKESLIEAGTIFKIKKDKSIIFKNKILALGKKENPIVFKSKNSKENWGAISLIGSKTNESILENVIIDGGSGHINKINTFTASLNLHNVNNLKLKNILVLNHKKSDDAVHLVYTKNINIENLQILDAPYDAIDIDISDSINITNSKIVNSGNDGIDFMESNAVVINSKIIQNKDKGISIGEGSNIEVKNTSIKENNIGIAAKDSSKVKIKETNFLNNKISVAAYKKNFHYNEGGYINIYNSKIIGKQINNSNFVIKNNSELYLKNTTANKKIFVSETLKEVNKNYIIN